MFVGLTVLKHDGLLLAAEHDPLVFVVGLLLAVSAIYWFRLFEPR